MAIERGRIDASEAGPRGLRDQIEVRTGFRAQVSVIRAGSMFDNRSQTPPCLCIWKGNEHGLQQDIH